MFRHIWKLAVVWLLLCFCSLAVRAVGNPVVVYAPPGQIINGFPLQLILDSSPVVTSSYSITYSLNLIQYTVSWNSSSSMTGLHDTYRQYLLANGWSIVNDEIRPTLLGLYALKGSFEFNVAIGVGINNGQLTGIQVTASFAARNPWPTLGHDNQRTNRSDLVGPSTPGVPTLLYDAGSAVGLGNNIIVTSDGKIVVSTCSTKVLAINPSGGILWTFPLLGTYNESAYGLTASSDGAIHVSVNDCPDIPGAQPMHFYSLNADGTLRWSVNQSGMYGSPAIAPDGTIYQGDEFARISAYDPATGSVLWTTPLCCFGNRSAALDSNGNLYIATDGGVFGSTSLWSLTPTGTVRWSTGTGNLVSAIVGPGDVIYAINSAGTLFCYHPDGSQCWTGYNTGGSAGENSLAVSSSGTVYAKTSLGLFAINPDGTSAWPSPFSPGGDATLSPSPVVDANGSIYMAFGNNVYSLKPDGSVRSGWPVTVPSAGQLVIGGNGILYVISGGQKLYSIGTARSCQVGPYKTYGQYQASPLTYRYKAWTQYPPLPPPPPSPVPQYFGFLPAPNYIPTGQAEPYVVCPTIVSGCALTSAATMLTSFGSLASLDPTQLDSQLKQNILYADSGVISLCPLDLPSCSTSQPDERVSYPDWCEFPWQNLKLAYPNVLALDNAGQSTNSELYDANQSAYVPVNEYLSDYVCTNEDRVIFQLDETISAPTGIVSHAGSHYVFVTGQSGSDWTLFDPGWSSATPSGSLSSLQGHLAGFQTSDGNLRTFSVTGARAYKDISSKGNRGALIVTASSPIELLVLDPQNRLLGNANGTDVFGIPGGSYFREYPLADDTNVGPANGDPTGIKTAYVEAPLSGRYQVTTTGTGLGMYTLTFRALATDGSFQTGTVVGVTNVGSTSTYKVGYSPFPGLSGPVTLAATFETTLADISNSLALGLIDNGGIANALSSKINEASVAAAGEEKTTAGNILNAFINQVNAQTGKHINGIAPQVLLADAQSLLSQI